MKNNVLLSIVLGTIAVVSVGFAVFFAIKVATLTKSLEQEKTNVAQEVEKNNNKNPNVQSVYALPEFKSSNCANAEDGVKYYYRKNYDKYGVTCSISQSRKYVNLTFDAGKIRGLYNISIPQDKLEVRIENLSDKVIDIYAESIDSSAVGNEVLLFLLDDGNVEYIPLYKALKEDDVKSYGKVPVIEDILSLFTLSIKTRVNNEDDEEDDDNFKEVKYETFDVPGALRNDGTFYNLSEYLYNTGNFKQEEKQ